MLEITPDKFYIHAINVKEALIIFKSKEPREFYDVSTHNKLIINDNNQEYFAYPIESGRIDDHLFITMKFDNETFSYTIMNNIFESNDQELQNLFNMIAKYQITLKSK